MGQACGKQTTRNHVTEKGRKKVEKTGKQRKKPFKIAQ
jgi:hypothetical protein